MAAVSRNAVRELSLPPEGLVCTVVLVGEVALELLPVTFSYGDARRAGVSKRQLYGWRDSGAVEVVGRGLFHRGGGAPVDLDLVEVSYRAPDATLCLTSALVRHGLSDAIPAWHDVAVRRGTRTPAVVAPVRWHRFDPATFEVGRGVIGIDDGLQLGLYGAERSIVDAFRLWRREGLDVAHEALRRWLRAGGKPADLMEVAAAFPRVEGRIRAALQVLL